MAQLIVLPELPQLAQSVAGDSLPRMPALAELLRLGGRAGAARDWRAGVLRDLDAATSVAESPATVAAAAAQVAAGAAVCIASPVHAVAGMNRVHLHAAGPLRLRIEEGARLAADFSVEFGDTGRLHAVGEEWLLEMPQAHAAAAGDPMDWAGAPLERAVAGSADQRALRRLGAEVEMWLAGLPLNRDRERRGELPVNSLWLWGGGAVKPLPAAARSPGIYVARVDAWTAGLARLCATRPLPLPAGWEELQQTQPPQPEAVVILSGAAAGGAQLLSSWDAAWFAPALRDLRARRTGALHLRIGAQGWQLRARPLSGLWRRARPWWQRVRA